MIARSFLAGYSAAGPPSAKLARELILKGRKRRAVVRVKGTETDWQTKMHYVCVLESICTDYFDPRCAHRSPQRRNFTLRRAPLFRREAD